MKMKRVKMGVTWTGVAILGLNLLTVASLVIASNHGAWAVQLAGSTFLGAMILSVVNSSTWYLDVREFTLSAEIMPFLSMAAVSFVALPFVVGANGWHVGVNHPAIALAVGYIVLGAIMYVGNFFTTNFKH